MYLLDYMNSHENWRELLAAEPYCIEIKQDGNYFLLKYNQLLSNFSLPICKECRGIIVRQENDKWIPVCIPFFKFFNAQEEYADTAAMDWSTTKVLQKVDGSLCKIWFDRDEWHVSSNGTIDARTNMIGDYTFYSLVEMAAGDLNKLFSTLDPDYTYMFELTTPYNKIVVQYEGCHLWYLGRRNNHTLQEDMVRPSFDNLLYPKLYDYHDLKTCYEVAEGMDLSEEGFVCVDAAYHRIKIKGAAYLEAHKIRGNGVLTLNRVCEMWQEETLDDFIAVCPEYTDYIENFKEAFARLAIEMAAAYIKNMFILDRRDYAKEAMKYPSVVRAYMFAKYDNKCGTAAEYLKNMRPKALSEILEDRM